MESSGEGQQDTAQELPEHPWWLWSSWAGGTVPLCTMHEGREVLGMQGCISSWNREMSGPEEPRGYPACEQSLWQGKQPSLGGNPVTLTEF